MPEYMTGFFAGTGKEGKFYKIFYKKLAHM